MSSIPASAFAYDFEVQRLLGKGNYASVQEVVHKTLKKRYAVKQIHTSNTQDLAQALNQIQVLKTLEDEHVTKIFYHYIKPMKKNGHYELGIIMQLCETTLTETIKQRKAQNNPFTTKQIMHFLNSVIPLFSMMQQKGYIHRDIKPDNILLNKQKDSYDYKVADFGFAVKVNHYSNRNIAGTMEYASPKLVVKFKNQKISVSGQTFKDDVYSLGKTMIEMMLLEMGQSLTINKVESCRKMYGKYIGCIVQKMIAKNENERLDFMDIESVLNSSKIIERPTSLNKFLNSTKKGRFSLDSRQTSCDYNESIRTKMTQPKKYQKIKSRGEGKVKNEVKMENIYEQKTLLKTEPPPLFLTTDRKSQKSREEPAKVVQQRVLKMKERIVCMTTSNKILFMGLFNKIGMMDFESEKVLLISNCSEMKKVTCLSISNDQQTLFVGSTNCKIYCIPILQLENVITNNYKSFKLNNTLQFPLSRLLFREIKVQVPALYLHPLPKATYKQVSLIVGHSTGEISVISKSLVQRKLMFLTAPLTCLKLQEGYLFGSSFEGVFKREHAYLLGIHTSEDVDNRLSKLNPSFSTSIVQFKSGIINFQIISNCHTNKNIEKEENQYLAIVAESSGFIHIISQSMNIEKTIRVAQNMMYACQLQVKPSHNYGAQGFFIDTAGILTNQKEEVLKKSGEKKLSCVAVKSNKIFLGSQFSERLLLITSTGDSIDLGL